MNTRYFLTCFATLMLLVGQLLAASNPVDVSISPKEGLPSSTTVGNHYVVVYTISNNLPFAVPVTLKLSGFNANFSIINQCNDQLLKPKNQAGSTCLFIVDFQPTAPDTVNAQITLNYHKNVVPLKNLTTTVTGQTGDVIGNTDENLPTITYVNQGPYEFVFSFKNISNISVSGNGTVSSNVNTWSITTNDCTNKTLAAGENCSISGTFSPTAISEVSITGIFKYNNEINSTKATTSTNVKQSSGPCTNLSTDVTLPLPTNSSQYSDNNVQFRFENECPQRIKLGPVALSATGASSIIKKGTDACSNKHLDPSEHCLVNAAVEPEGTGQLTFKATVNAGGVNHTASTTSSIGSNPYQHKVTFINQCPFDVWYGITNDSPNKLDPTNPATPDDYKLTQQLTGVAPSSKSVTFNDEFIGIMFPRTDCTTTNGQLSCLTGNCLTQPAPNGGKCLEGNDPISPVTRLEFNLFQIPQTDSSFDGVYDVSVLDGPTIPVEIKGLGPTSEASIPTTAQFQCRGAGAPLQRTTSTLGRCPWTFMPPSIAGISPVDYNFVSDGGESTSNCKASGCTGTDVCGLAFKATNPNLGKVVRRCGKLLGYWSTKQICDKPTSNFDPETLKDELFDCDANLNTITSSSRYTSSATVGDFYACDFVAGIPQFDSCYSSTENTCCGCYNWNQQSSTLPVTAQARNCDGVDVGTSNNPDWGGGGATTSIAFSPFDSILWLKKACPTSYVYPFDDPSSSFDCKKSSSGFAKMDYQIIFCPGGKSGR